MATSKVWLGNNVRDSEEWSARWSSEGAQPAGPVGVGKLPTAGDWYCINRTESTQDLNACPDSFAKLTSGFSQKLALVGRP
jgi:hypothetical protein